jgi:hypothetical protein
MEPTVLFGTTDNSMPVHYPDNIQAEASIPKIVHAPHRNDDVTTVDHTYRDYSVIDESMLAIIEAGNEDSEVMQRVKSALTEVLGPIIAAGSTGGVTKTFPEKVSLL